MRSPELLCSRTNLKARINIKQTNIFRNNKTMTEKTESGVNGEQLNEGSDANTDLGKNAFLLETTSNEGF